MNPTAIPKREQPGDGNDNARVMVRLSTSANSDVGGFRMDSMGQLGAGTYFQPRGNTRIAETPPNSSGTRAIAVRRKKTIEA